MEIESNVNISVSPDDRKRDLLTKWHLRCRLDAEIIQKVFWASLPSTPGAIHYQFFSLTTRRRSACLFNLLARRWMSVGVLTWWNYAIGKRELSLMFSMNYFTLKSYAISFSYVDANVRLFLVNILMFNRLLVAATGWLTSREWQIVSFPCDHRWLKTWRRKVPNVTGNT